MKIGEKKEKQISTRWKEKISKYIMKKVAAGGKEITPGPKN